VDWEWSRGRGLGDQWAKPPFPKAESILAFRNVNWVQIYLFFINVKLCKLLVYASRKNIVVYLSFQQLDDVALYKYEFKDSVGPLGLLANRNECGKLQYFVADHHVIYVV